MAYSQFKTLTNVKETFGITTNEGIRFLPDLDPIQPSTTLNSFLAWMAEN